jgi:curved DNA-binding protein CbpA
MIDHYKTLGLDKTATTTDVKKAFRRLAKKYHPDRNGHRSEWATTRMKRLIEANTILSSDDKRLIYDRRHQRMCSPAPAPKTAKHYRPEKSPLATQADRILDCLLNGKSKRAVEDYERLIQTKGGFELSDHLDLRDWVDAKFLIAEEYERMSEYTKALDIYESLYHCEKAKKRRPNLIHDVSERILRICSRKISPSRDPEMAAGYLMRALALELTKAKRAHLHKKLAECHLAIGNDAAARDQLIVAFQLKPDLKGATKICKRLAYEPVAL